MRCPNSTASSQAVPHGVAPSRPMSTDEAVAVKFYADNPSAALVDMKRRIDGVRGQVNGGRDGV